jgi:hypothetical protein
MVNKYIKRWGAKAEYKKVEGLPGAHWVVEINDAMRQELQSNPQVLYSIRRGLRNDRTSTDIAPEQHSGIENIYAPLAGYEKTWDNRDFIGKPLRGPSDLSRLASVARDPRMEINHIFVAKNGIVTYHRAWSSARSGEVTVIPGYYTRGGRSNQTAMGEALAEFNRTIKRIAKLGGADLATCNTTFRHEIGAIGRRQEGVNYPSRIFQGKFKGA